jgi:hypothetical protein
MHHSDSWARGWGEGVRCALIKRLFRDFFFFTIANKPCCVCTSLQIPILENN